MSVSFSRIKDAWAEGTGSIDTAPFDSIGLDRVSVSVSYNEADVRYMRESARAVQMERNVENRSLCMTEEGREQIRRMNVRFYKRHRDCVLEKARKRYAERGEEQKRERRAYLAEYYANNKERILKRKKEAYDRRKAEKGS